MEPLVGNVIRDELRLENSFGVNEYESSCVLLLILSPSLISVTQAQHSRQLKYLQNGVVVRYFRSLDGSVKALSVLFGLTPLSAFQGRVRPTCHRSTQ